MPEGDGLGLTEGDGEGLTEGEGLTDGDGLTEGEGLTDGDGLTEGEGLADGGGGVGPSISSLSLLDEHADRAKAPTMIKDAEKPRAAIISFNI